VSEPKERRRRQLKYDDTCHDTDPLLAILPMGAIKKSRAYLNDVAWRPSVDYLPKFFASDIVIVITISSQVSRPWREQRRWMLDGHGRIRRSVQISSGPDTLDMSPGSLATSGVRVLLIIS